MNCQHPDCDCSNAKIQRDGKSYCSEGCATSSRSADDQSCGCGHAGCGKTARSTEIPDRSRAASRSPAVSTDPEDPGIGSR